MWRRVVYGRVNYLQVIEAERYLTLAEDNRINLRLLPPRRGHILDRMGRISHRFAPPRRFGQRSSPVAWRPIITSRCTWDAHHEPKAQHQRDDRRTAVGNQRQRHADHGEKTHHHRHVDEQIEEERRGDADRHQNPSRCPIRAIWSTPTRRAAS